MSFYLRVSTRGRTIDRMALEATAQRLLEAAGEGGSSLALSLVGDTAIRRLNLAHRGKDAATDVLSFPLYEPGEAPPSGVERLLGDVVISVPAAARQAAAYDATLQAELQRLLIHGILHLLGHDHEEPAERTDMEAEERRLAGTIGMPWPY